MRHWPPWVESQGNNVFEKLGLEEDGIVTVNVMQMASCVDGLCKVGMVYVEAFALARLNH
jgi:hypothetical protein